MANSTYIQNVYYHYVLSEPTILMQFQPDFFTGKTVQTAFRIAKDYAVKYHEAPSADQMKELTSLSNVKDILPDDVIDSLYAQKPMVDNYTDEWLYDKATNWAILENMKRSMVDAMAYLKLNQDEAENGNSKEVVEHIKTMFNRGCVIDFADELDTGSDFWDAECHKQKKLIRSSAGYPFIDFCLNGGYFPGCLTCFVGAPKVGKSLWMQNLCAESVKKGENCVYVTLELPEEMVLSRIGSNMFSIPSLEYDKYTNDTALFKERIQAYRRGCLVQPGQLVVKQYPTSTLTVIELESYLLKKEEELSTEGHPFKFKNVFVDYLNIMKNYRNPNSENTYMKIKQLAEDIKAMGTKNNWSIITATQTNRSQFDTNDIQANQVSESSGLGATVDIMFGIIADALMMAQGKYYLKCIYDRVSPQANKKKLFDCNFNYLRISESPEEGIIDAALFPVQDSSRFIGEAGRQNAARNAQNQQQTFPSGQPTISNDNNNESLVPLESDEPRVYDLMDNDVTSPPPQDVGVLKISDVIGPLIKYRGLGFF